MEDTDAQLQLKKRARRRLVGAVAFVMLVAVTLPMIMDHEPKPTAQDVEIRIPGQDEKPFAPKFATAPVDKPAAVPAKPAAAETAPPAPAPTVAVPAKPEDKPKPTASVVETTPAPKPADKPAEKPAEKPPAKPAKPAEKPADKPAEKAVEKAAEKPPAKDGDAEAKRAAAILAGKAPDTAAAPKGGEPHVILIGAFANEGNVKNIRNKLGELGIKVYTEPLDSPQGPKTRVRAGPFPSREAAEKALEKMKRIGVSGVVAAK